MKKPPFEERVRKLIQLSEPILEWVKSELENDGDKDTYLYKDAILSLTEIKELKNEIGFYTPIEYKTELKQIEIPY